MQVPSKHPGVYPNAPAGLENYERFWSHMTTVDNLKIFTSPFRAEYEAWPESEIYNGWFEAGDIELYYSIIRSLRPNRIIEIGSGFSSRIAAEAFRINGCGALLSIDPSPRTRLPEGAEQLQARVEDVSIAIFDRLNAGDILFIDSSHTAEEANYHQTILDLLADGVVVHHHDCFFPYAPRYPEENILHAHYMSRARRWEGLINNALARHVLGSDGYAQIFPAYSRDTARIPGSIYTRKRKITAAALE